MVAIGVMGAVVAVVVEREPGKLHGQALAMFEIATASCVGLANSVFQ
jgi:hypothetical protein